MMTISIVLPVYNGERYLASAIKSILQQTFDDFELIIVNDASLDRSLEIAKFFAQKDSRIKIICNEVNKKLPASLNIGFNKASGSYLTWTSHDNLLKPDCILRLKEELIQRNVDIVYANCEEIDENDNIQLVKRRDENIDELSHRNIIGACFLYKLAVHESLGGYNENLFLIEDYDFWARSYFEGFRFYHLNEELYLYRRHNNSLSISFSEKVTFIRLKYILKNIQKCRSKRSRDKILSEVKYLYKKFNWTPPLNNRDGSILYLDLPESLARLDSNPFNLFYYYHSAKLYSRTDDYSAEKLLEDIVSIFPYWEDGNLLLLDILLKQRKITEAIDLMQKAVALDECNGIYRKNLLALLRSQSHPPQVSG